MYVAFSVAGEARILPAAAVAAVTELGELAALPTADRRRLGLTVHQGTVVAIVAPGFEDGEGRRSPLPATPSHLLVLRRGGGTVGLAVDGPIGLRVAYGDALPEGCSLLEWPALPSAGGPGRA
jgi:hypothetical protein